MLNTADILGPQGRIAQRLSNYEHRDQQLEMAAAVADALHNERHLLVEAGTGVGKSFAYLVPAILEAMARREKNVKQNQARKGRNLPTPEAPPPAPHRIVVSTHTISLQEQLITKDIPFLQQVIPGKFRAVLVKGRSNYLSRRRLKNARQRANSTFAYGREISQLGEVASWVNDTADGSKSDLPFRPFDTVWSEVASDSGNCMGKKCPTFETCFYYQARRQLHQTDLLIVNHALFFSDLALRRQRARLLPDYHAVIFDEAHTLEAVAGDHMGIKATSGQVQYILNKLLSSHGDKGLLSRDSTTTAQKLVNQCQGRADAFFHEQFEALRFQPGRSGRADQTATKPHPLCQSLNDLAEEVASISEKFKGASAERRQDYISASDRLRELAQEIETWRQQKQKGAVYWRESGYARRSGNPTITLAAAPIDIGPSMREQLFEQTPSVIMTSATISIGRQPNFDFFQSRVGLQKVQKTKTLRLGSPFDYRKQAQLILVRGMPDPSRQRQQFENLCPQMIQRYVSRTQGRAFVLFTSYEMLRRCAEQLKEWMSEHQLSLLSQADGIPRTKMLERFKTQPRSVLFGVESFWQGVDVPGEALQNVIITKLPFSVPDQPLLEARLDAIRNAGGNPFMEYQVPESVIKLRQGFGRLIRTQQDKGIVVLLDPRVSTKPYGRIFLDSLPDCQVVDEAVDEKDESA